MKYEVVKQVIEQTQGNLIFVWLINSQFLFQDFDAGSVFSLLKIVHEDDGNLNNSKDSATETNFSWKAVVNKEGGLKASDSGR